MIDIYDILTPVLIKLEEDYEQELDQFFESDFKRSELLVSNHSNERNYSSDYNRECSFFSSKVSIEKRVYTFIKNYSKIDVHNELEAEEILLRSIGNLRKVIFLQNAIQNFEEPPFLKAILCLSPFWIRDPLEWTGKDGKSLLKHLFVKYPVPESLYNEWYSDNGSLSQKWLSWFIILAQGGSLKVASKLFGWKIYSRFQHFYMQHEKSVKCQKHACIYSEIRRMGGPGFLTNYIFYNPAYGIDPTDFERKQTFDDFWYKTIEWLIRHCSELEHEQFEKILEWAMHKYTEAEREKRTFSWKGRALQNVIRLSEKFAITKKFGGKDIRWNSRDMNWQHLDSNDRIWTIKELTSAKELYEEGIFLQHCAGEYLDRCLSNETAIFSMSCNHVKRITIEFDLKKGLLKQARGKKNRSLKKLEVSVLKKWLAFQEKRKRKQALNISKNYGDLLRKYDFVSLDRFNYRGNKMLHEMVMKGVVSDLKMVLNAGIDIDSKNQKGETALMVAASYRKEKAVDLLLKQGSDVNYELSEELNALSYAIGSAGTPVIRRLLSEDAVIRPHHIYQVSRSGNRLLLRLLIQFGGDVNMQTEHGKTALLHAICKRDYSSIRTLLEFGAEIDALSYFEAMACNDNEINILIRDPLVITSADNFG